MPRFVQQLFKEYALVTKRLKRHLTGTLDRVKEFGPVLYNTHADTAAT